jgi:hypothetical protein
MPNVNYELDPATGRYLRHDAQDPALAGDIVLAPGELAEIADDGRLQGILTRARFLAAHSDDPTAEGDLIRSLWSLHEVAGALEIRWRSLAGFHRFAATVEAAWKAVGEQAFIHYISTEPEPICWSEGLDPSDERYRRKTDEQD